MLTSKRYKITGLVLIVLLGVIFGRVLWLGQQGKIEFESDIVSLLPLAENSQLLDKIQSRVSSLIRNRIVILVQGEYHTETDDAADQLVDLIDQAISNESIHAKLIEGASAQDLLARIDAMRIHKNKLIGTQSRGRILDSPDAQLIWRMNQVTQFPPTNITDPVADPLGTVEAFLLERMPNISGVSADGPYLRVQGDVPINLIQIELEDGEMGNDLASDSVRWMFEVKDKIANEFGVTMFISGIPIHAVTIKDKTVKEIRWMASLALVFSLGVFFYITRSIRALFFTFASIVLAIGGGILLSFETVGLPHLIGLTMATTAIGICIDFSFHFWIFVRSGMSGVDALRTIFPGLNMSFVTTAMGLLAVSIVSIPVLSRTAMFIFGALLISWLVVLCIFPFLGDRPGTTIFKSTMSNLLPMRLCKILVLVFCVLALFGMVLKFYTDDSPGKIGPKIEWLAENQRVVDNILGSSDTGIYLVQAESAESLVLVEKSLLHSLSLAELKKVSAVSRLVPPQSQQQQNQMLYDRIQNNLDPKLLASYLAALGVTHLNWRTEANNEYTLDWVLVQPWADVENHQVLVCAKPTCASMIQARDEAAAKLDVSCQNEPSCTRVSFSERQQSAFQTLRHELGWSLLLAMTVMLVTLYFRYGNFSFKLMAVPILAVICGISAVSWMGMPVTAFTLAAMFPLLGLSVDYVVFASESSDHANQTFLAIFASALTTTVSFGILSFSETPAVQFFALPVAVGIPVAWVAMHVFRIRHV